MRARRIAAAGVAVALACAASATLAAAAPPAPGAIADVNGIRMYYESHGRGPVLVLLHGGAGDGRQFGKQVPAFERTHRVIVPDMCAQGRTTDRAAPLTYHSMAEDVIALMDRLHVTRFDCLGWSDGGVTGLDLAIHHPDRLRRLVTFGANFAPDGLNAPDVAWNDTATAAAFGDGMREGWTKQNPQPGNYVNAMTKVIHLWKAEPRFTPRELGSIRARVMVCAGEHDVVRDEHTRALARAIPHATLWIVPGASHSAMQEQPDLVNARVLEFLSPDRMNRKTVHDPLAR